MMSGKGAAKMRTKSMHTKTSSKPSSKKWKKGRKRNRALITLHYLPFFGDPSIHLLVCVCSQRRSRCHVEERHTHIKLQIQSSIISPSIDHHHPHHLGAFTRFMTLSVSSSSIQSSTASQLW